MLGYNPKSGRLVVSHDIEFDEEGNWDWNVQDKNYNFLPVFDDPVDNQAVSDDAVPQSPPHNAAAPSVISPQSSLERPRRTKSLAEIYAETEEYSTLFCLYAYSEPIACE